MIQSYELEAENRCEWRCKKLMNEVFLTDVLETISFGQNGRALNSRRGWKPPSSLLTELIQQHSTPARSKRAIRSPTHTLISSTNGRRLSPISITISSQLEAAHSFIIFSLSPSLWKPQEHQVSTFREFFVFKLRWTDWQTHWLFCKTTFRNQGTSKRNFRWTITVPSQYYRKRRRKFSVETFL